MTPQTLQKWHRDKIGNLGRVVTGKTPPTAHKEFYVGEFPFITPSDISTFDVRYISDTERTISSFWASKNKKYILPRDAITYVCIGSTVGKIGLTEKESITNQQINALVANPLKLVPQYGYYLLRNITPEIQQIASARGAGKGIMNKSQFEDFDVTVPSVDDQQSIADILSRYDDLIENNTLRIQILEQTSQAVYAEWFVNFRFPGHEKVKMVNSGTNFGEIPDDWKVTNLSELVDFVRGIEPGSDNYKSEYKAGRIPFLRVGDLGSRNSNIFIDSDLVGDNVVSKTDIAVTMDGTVGRVAIGFYGAYSTGIRKLVIKNKIINREYLYLLMLSDFIQDIIKSHAKGTTILHASESIKYMQFVLPNQKIMDDLCILAKPLIDGILVLREQNQNLANARNLLIPKLVTGEIKI